MNSDEITKVLGCTWRRARAPSSDTLLDLKKRDRIAAQCRGKKRHATSDGAKVEAKMADAFLDIYLCDHCGFYHVGKNRERHKVVQKRRRKTKK
jgi:rubrerythrin